MAAKKRRRGRPALPKAERRRQIISVRLRDETKARLEQDAAAGGRSLSQEVEHRIEREYDRKDMLIDLLRAAWGDRHAGLLLLIARTLRMGTMHVGAVSEVQKGNLTGSGWQDYSMEQPQTYREVTEAIGRVLKKLSPLGDLPEPDGMQVNGPKGMQALSGFIADAVLESVPKDAEIRPLLGSLAPLATPPGKTK